MEIDGIESRQKRRHEKILRKTDRKRERERGYILTL